KTTDLWEHDITSPKYARFQIGATKHLWVSKWRHEHLPWLMMVEIMRSLCLARMLLHAQRSERTNITHLPAHIINDIVVQASRNPAAIIPRQ
ncbi:hypothetical protein NY486_09775, partial [Enterobacter hormaechei]|nr:hypothetical protein [Enterobacter hormaechei]